MSKQSRLESKSARPMVPISRPVPLARANVRPEPEVKEVTVSMPTLRLRFDRQFKIKLLFLVVLMFLFVLTCVMFDRTSFTTKDIADVARIDYNLPKLWSLAFVIFILLFSLCVSLSIYFGAYQHPLLSLLVLLVTIVPALILSVFYPHAMLPFVAFSLTLSAAASMASVYKVMSFSRIWSITNKAMLILALLAFLVVFSKVAANKDAHIDLMLSGISGGIPGSQDTSSLINSLPINKQTLTTALDKDTIRAIITKSDYEDVMQSYPGYSALSSSEQQAALDSAYASAVDKIYSGVDARGDVLAASLKDKLAQQFSGSGQEVSTALLKQQLSQVPAFVAFYNNFALFSGFLVFGITMVFGLFVQLLASGMTLLLSK
ncbi:MAG: hypothetical protein V1834_02355, partial [Candidatus Micrarchaeota archaeon]